MATSLFGASPTEQLSPVACFHGLLQFRSHLACAPPDIAFGIVGVDFLVGRQTRRDDVGEIDVDLVDAAIFDLRRDRVHRRLEES